MIFDYKECERLIGYTFKDKDLLVNAFTHSSFTNEHKEYISNERLEFLGDSILGFVVTDRLYKLFPTADEGDLTVKKQSLVSKRPLSRAILNLGLQKFLLTNDSDYEGHNKINLAENLFEAIVAAIYLDGGLAPAAKFIFSLLDPKSTKQITRSNEKTIDYKSQLLHLAQTKRLGKIEYFQISSEGPPHKPTFVMGIKINGKLIATGKGPSHKEGEKIAAKQAINILQSEDFKL